MGRFLPPDHSAGDERTLGGYLAVHARPPAFEAEDGYSYSVAVGADRTGGSGTPGHPPERSARWGGFLLFLRWRRVGAQSVDGHLETGFLVTADSETAAMAAVHALPLTEVQAQLDILVQAEMEQSHADRHWWDVMHDEGNDA